MFGPIDYEDDVDYENGESRLADDYLDDQGEFHDDDDGYLFPDIDE